MPLVFIASITLHPNLLNIATELNISSGRPYFLVWSFSGSRIEPCGGRMYQAVSLAVTREIHHAHLQLAWSQLTDAPSLLSDPILCIWVLIL